MNAKFYSATVILLAGLFSVAFADLQLAPVNPDFENYFRNKQKISAAPQFSQTIGHYFGLIPSPVNLSHLNGKSISWQAPGMPAITMYGPSFDLRTQSPAKLTPVKNQGQFGTCWAFATNASLESCLMPAETRNFSENNIVNLAGFDLGYNDGGNGLMSAAYLLRWDGPVNTSADPYNLTTKVASPPGLPVQKHLQEALVIPDRGSPSDNNNIKQAVTTYGAVMTSLYMDETVTDGFLNLATTSYYFNGSSSAGSNHAVAIVGWDDNYDLNRFATHPAGNGAFIVKNSWGVNWGDKGYFYVSYYDSLIGTGNVVFDVAESTGNYSTIYQYDTLGMTGTLGYSPSDTAWFANIFTSTSNVQLSAIGFYTLSLNSTYSLYIYNSFNGATFTGQLGSQAGTVSIPGYHTIKLNSAITIPVNQKFCVVVEITTPLYGYPIAIENPVTGYSSRATASSGQSYISSNGTSWTDITAHFPNTNVCLKAYAGEIFSPALLSSITNVGVYPNPSGSGYTHPKSSQGIIATFSVQFTAPPQAMSLDIYTISGEHVKAAGNNAFVISAKALAAQKCIYEYDWDGRNDSGESVAPAVYIYRVVADGVAKVGKMAVVR